MVELCDDKLLICLVAPSTRTSWVTFTQRWHGFFFAISCCFLRYFFRSGILYRCVKMLLGEVTQNLSILYLVLLDKNILITLDISYCWLRLFYCPSPCVISSGSRRTCSRLLNKNQWPFAHMDDNVLIWWFPLNNSHSIVNRKQNPKKPHCYLPRRIWYKMSCRRRIA